MLKAIWSLTLVVCALSICGATSWAEDVATSNEDSQITSSRENRRVHAVNGSSNEPTDCLHEKPRQLAPPTLPRNRVRDTTDGWDENWYNFAPKQQPRLLTAQAVADRKPTGWTRFSYYPYVYYPHNFQVRQQYCSLHNRYPQSRQIPVYNKGWYNLTPEKRPNFSGRNYVLDVF